MPSSPPAAPEPSADDWITVAPQPKPAPPKRQQGPRIAGSGFFVTTDGDVLTNAHVVAGCEAITLGARAPANVFDQFDDKLRLTPLRRDDKLDLALLGARHHPDAAAAFRGDPPPGPGDSVIDFGFPCRAYYRRRATSRPAYSVR